MRFRKILSFAIIVGAVFFVDRAGKYLAAEYLADGRRLSYLADLLRLEFMHNSGAILGLGSQLPGEIRRWVMPLATILILAWVSVILIREKGFGWAAAGFSLVWGGGFANLVDRIAYGQVVDFFNLGVGQIRTGTSNLADLAIVAGIPLILIGWLPSKPKEPGIGAPSDAGLGKDPTGNNA